MSKSFRYVSDFVFPSEAGYSGSAGRTMVKGYARGGKVCKTKMAEGGYAEGGSSRVKNVIRNEREELNRVEAKRRDAGKEIKRVKSEMRYDKAELRGNKPGPMMLKKGGAARAEAKVGKVMGEYKEGKLHSGSKTGPKVTNRKQAVAIALSEARNAGAKIPMKKQLGGEVGRAAKAGALSDIAKKVGSRVTESISSRPTDSSGRRITIEELNRTNRDIGGMSAAEIKSMREALRRAERISAEEAQESRIMNRAKGGMCRKK